MGSPFGQWWVAVIGNTSILANISGAQRHGAITTILRKTMSHA
jgi:hypothetical protein